ncbi:hypothetical protein [Formosa algae]|uniref:hypothetical protein n=1 Tax=Formosa algae TaxID=225843 RepID=UPI000CCF7936|nr:hypothetical protein [Formosa algae]PNW27414.1 hypothetical protein BKP44_13375 [Formosa algae]
MRQKINRETGEKTIYFSEDERDQLSKIKDEFIRELNDYIYIEKEELLDEYSTHLTNSSIRYALYNLRHHIINDLYYNDYFRDIAFFVNGFVEFKESKFLEFAYAYNILYDTDKAYKLLRNVLRVQIINWSLDNEFNDDTQNSFVFKYLRPKDINTSNLKDRFDSKTFKTANDERLFNLIIKNATFKFNRANVGALHDWFVKYLNCNKYNFALYWNSLDLEFKIRIYKNNVASFDSITNHRISKQLDELKKRFNKVK